MKEWIKKYFNETWEKIDVNIDFSNHIPISTSSSLHVYEERYEIDGKKYRLLYAIGCDENPLVEVLM